MQAKKSAQIIRRVRRENSDLAQVSDEIRLEQRIYDPERDPDSG
jgi:hypothetical protein